MRSTSAPVLIIFVVLTAALGLVFNPTMAQATAGAPSVAFQQGSMLLEEPFDSPDAWEQYENLMKGVELGVEDGVYRASTFSPGYVWGLNSQEHTDIILQVEAVPLSIAPDTAFGVMCRADVSNNGDGYYFMINSSGFYSIRVGEGNAILPMVDWELSSAIKPEIDRNVLRVVCLGDYLAMYVNDTLLAEVHDSTYASGYAGLAIGAVEGSTADVTFDNLTIYQAIAS